MAQEQGKDEAAMEEEFFQTARPTSLVQRFIEPEEVAEMIAYVCSPVSSATNGASLRADGGVVRSVF
ncbi:MAG: SDR family oxidoreductase, partial [Actinobacteria bacterium]|nr:SDR family oxidoreductase [Actinomycetota bacterium]